MDSDKCTTQDVMNAILLYSFVLTKTTQLKFLDISVTSLIFTLIAICIHSRNCEDVFVK